jgi:hypothetical protein
VHPEPTVDVTIYCSNSGNLKITTKKVLCGYAMEANFEGENLVVVVRESLDEAKREFATIIADIGDVFAKAARGCE